MPQKLFQTAVILDEVLDENDQVKEAAEIILPIETILARDEQQAQIKVSRKIPDSVIESKMDRLTVVVRPF